MAQATAIGQFTRGQVLRLSAHPEHCADQQELFELCRNIRASDPGKLLAADLFSGAGGMSLGLEQAGMRVVFGADHDAEALETHAHHFGGMSVDWDLGDADTRRGGRRDPASGRHRCHRRRPALPAVLKGRAVRDAAPGPPG